MFSLMRDRLMASSGMPQTDITHGGGLDSELITPGDSESTDGSDLESGHSGSSGMSFLDKIGLGRTRSNSNNSIDLRELDTKKGVLKVFKAIEHLALTNDNIGLVAFLELIKNSYYPHVNLSLLKSFMEHHMIVPKPFYTHYYVYFLHYSEYYHYVRSTNEIIDPDKIQFHQECLANIKEHLKYVYHIINRRRVEPPP